MEYNLTELASRVKKTRTFFIIKESIILILMIAALILAILGLHDSVTVISIVLEFPLAYFLVSVFTKSSAKIILSTQIKGENIKEHEYAVESRLRNRTTAYKGVNMPHTYENKKAEVNNISGSVFLRLDDGNIKEIRALPENLMDFYEIGDILLKPAGAKYPMVINKPASKQVCPYCGTINSENEESCSGCGLGIINKH